MQLGTTERSEGFDKNRKLIAQILQMVVAAHSETLNTSPGPALSQDIVPLN